MLIHLDNELTEEKIKNAGGKFRGLCQALPYIEEIKEKYDIKIKIPKTYAIPFDALESGVDDDVISNAMKALVACGGLVAIRSSANIEDGEENSHSGEFDSVLNVKNKKEMIEALNKVYQSQNNIDGAKMAIIIQEMISKPKIAGVVYSQDFNGDPMCVINYVEGKTADKLLVGREEGKTFKISKYYQDENSKLKLFSLNAIKQNQERGIIYFEGKNNELGSLYLSSTVENDKNIMLPLMFANHLEDKMQKPVDFEFAISQDNEFNLLQQRPYVISADYILKKTNEDEWSGYNKDNEIIRGRVLDVDQFNKNNKRFNDTENKILLSKTLRSYQYLPFILAKAHEDVKELKSPKLMIDCNGLLQNWCYSHYGNKLREMGQPIISSKNAEKFSHIKDGDFIEINMKTGNVKVYPLNKDKEIGIANIIKTLKQQKHKNR